MAQNDDDDEAAGYQGHYGLGTDPPGWVDGAPTSARNQACAFCGGSVVTWVHPLDAEHVQFRVFGKGHTLPTFWALCDRCEAIYVAGDDDAAVDLMKVSRGWLCESEANVDQEIRQPLMVFRRADKGARRLVN